MKNKKILLIHSLALFLKFGVSPKEKDFKMIEKSIKKIQWVGVIDFEVNVIKVDFDQGIKIIHMYGLTESEIKKRHKRIQKLFLKADLYEI